MKLNKNAKVLISVLCVSLVLGISWGVYKAVKPPPDFSESVDLSDYEALHAKYLLPVSISSIGHTSWIDIETLYPDSVTIYYLVRLNLDTPNFDSTKITPIDAKKVETFIQRHFDVSTKFLRKSDYYDAETNKYDFIGLGAPGLTKITDAKLDKNKLILDYEAYSRTDEVTVGQTGTLTIELSEDSYKYVSCSVVNID